MLLAVPVIGKILGSLASSETAAASAPQKPDSAKNSGAARAVDFAQTVDSLDPSAGAKTAQHGPLAGGKV
jgi:hypothetical protein